MKSVFIILGNGFTIEFLNKYNDFLENRKMQNVCIDVNAARVFFDYDRIEFYDEEHSQNEDRYNTIGDVETGKASESEKTDNENVIVGNVNQFIGKVNDILFVVYTERMKKESDGRKTDVIRLISARMATNFERGLYYGKYS